MTRIVTTAYRYKRPPKRKAKAAPLAVPVVVRKRGRADAVESPPDEPKPAAPSPANDDSPPLRSCREVGDRYHHQPQTDEVPARRAGSGAGARRSRGRRRDAGVARTGELGPQTSRVTRTPLPARHWPPTATTTRCRLAPRPWMNPFAAFPSWFLRVTCERCGHERMFSEVHSAQRAMLIRDMIAKLRHDGCGGRTGKARAAHRHRGRVQPPGAEDRAAGGLKARQQKAGRR